MRSEGNPKDFRVTAMRQASVRWCRFPLVLAAVAGSLDRVDAGPVVAVLAGAQCDSPSVRDGAAFPSRCGVRPIAGAGIGWRSGPWRVELEGVYGLRIFSSTAFVSDAPVRVDVLDFAAVAAWRLSRRPAGFTLSIRGGPQLGSRLRARRRFREADEDITSHLREADVKALFGVRLGRQAAGGEWFVDGRLSWGLSNLDNTRLHEIRARTILVGFGFER